MGEYHPAAESKAVPKVNAGYQSITIPDETATPATGTFIRRENKDLVVLETPSEFDGTLVTWKGCHTLEDALAGNWTTMEWEGADLTTDIGTAGNAACLDPLKFSGYRFLSFTSDANQSSGDAVFYVILRDFSR
jgi:hypothetical protein